MKKRKLGQSSLLVSLTGMGVSNFGMRDDIDPDALVATALAAGINFFDTADVYSAGRSEELLGLALRRRRSEAIVATKWGGLIKGDPAPVGGGSQAFIIAACEASLRRLGMDHIDLYQFHHPDPVTPIEDTLAACDALIRAGKVRHIGVSNMPEGNIAAAQDAAHALGLPGFVTCQEQYSLLHRGDFEGDMAALVGRSRMSLLPFFPLASGMLTGKYRPGEPFPEDSRFAKITGKYERFRSDDMMTTAARLERFALERGHSLLELAFSWLASNPLVGSIIAGATRPVQVLANAAATGWVLNAADSAAIDRITLPGADA